MGEESYQGAKGGFVFVCPSSGTIKVKLYASSEQFPAILYQVLQEIEAEGYACREMYVDTFKVNFSAAAEEVAAMFKVRICCSNDRRDVAKPIGRSSSSRWELLGIIRCIQCDNSRHSAPTRKQQHEPTRNQERMNA
jgi:hypothetical protein